MSGEASPPPVINNAMDIDDIVDYGTPTHTPSDLVDYDEIAKEFDEEHPLTVAEEDANNATIVAAADGEPQSETVVESTEARSHAASGGEAAEVEGLCKKIARLEEELMDAKVDAKAAIKLELRLTAELKDERAERVKLAGKYAQVSADYDWAANRSKALNEKLDQFEERNDELQNRIDDLERELQDGNRARKRSRNSNGGYAPSSYTSTPATAVSALPDYGDISNYNNGNSAARPFLPALLQLAAPRQPAWKISIAAAMDE
ncbi:hypothetical protein B0H13DRAFT_1885415 [Mycena leptocephala]|nr:hypothetical protein B0H13DRAFT_1885415 [Mycena leptocephala]